MSTQTRFRPKPKRPAFTADHERALAEPTATPEAAAAAIREHYLRYCSPSLNAFLTAPAYGILFADAHSSVHPDLIGPIVTTRDEAIALHAAAKVERPEVQSVVVAGVTANRRIALAAQGFVIAEDDLMAPGTRVFIDRYGRTPKALLRAHRREGQPLEVEIPAPPPGVL